MFLAEMPQLVYVLVYLAEKLCEIEPDQLSKWYRVSWCSELGHVLDHQQRIEAFG